MGPPKGPRASNVCRTCLKKTHASFSVHKPLNEVKDDMKIQQALNYLVPEFYMGVTVDPVICQDCKISLRIAYAFKKTCLETEQIVGNYMRTAGITGQWIDLKHVLLLHDASKADLPKSSTKNHDKTIAQDVGASGIEVKHLTFCEQSGLFVDDQGNFFNAHGDPVDQSQIETEKANINEKLDKLFEITSVYSLSEEQDNSVDNLIDTPTVASTSTNNESTNVKDAKEPPKKNWIKIAPKEKLFGPTPPPLLLNKSSSENPKKRNYVEVNVSETTEYGEVNKRMKVINEDILNKNIPVVKSPKKPLVVKDKIVPLEAPKVNQPEGVVGTSAVSLNSPSRCLLEFPDKEATPLFVKTKIPRQKLTIKRRRIKDKQIVDKLIKPKKIEEPLQQDQPPICTAEEDDINEIIKNLYDDGESQYVDVPEFIQIKQFTFSDLKDMQREKSSSIDQVAPPENIESSNMGREPDIATEKPDIATEKPDTATEKPAIATEKPAIATENPDRATANNETVAENTESVAENHARSTIKPEKPTENSNRSTKKPERPTGKPDRATEKPAEPPEIVKSIQNTEEPEPATQSADTAKPAKKVTGRPSLSLRKLNKGNCGTTFINRLLESYAYDGTYVKDHDYLSNPYKMEEILRVEGERLMSFCYICGSSHPLESHVEHMSDHDAHCKICAKNYNTPFALNIHCKEHLKEYKETESDTVEKVTIHSKEHIAKVSDTVERENIQTKESPKVHKAKVAETVERGNICSKEQLKVSVLETIKCEKIDSKKNSRLHEEKLSQIAESTNVHSKEHLGPHTENILKAGESLNVISKVNPKVHEDKVTETVEKVLKTESSDETFQSKMDEGNKKTDEESEIKYRDKKPKLNTSNSNFPRRELRSSTRRSSEPDVYDRESESESTDSTMEISPNPEESSNAVTVQVDVHHRHCSQLSASVATTNHVCVNETQATSDVSSIHPGYPKTAAERMRQYRARKKKETLTVNYQKQKRSAAERAKEYRIRKKMKIHSGDTASE